MQPTTTEQRALITARNVTVGYGADLLDENDNVIGDLSQDLVGGKVERGNRNTIHATCTITLLRALDWDTARVRLWQRLTTSTATSLWYLGVYVLTTPKETVGDEAPGSWDVVGYDKLVLLRHAVPDTYVVPSGTKYLDAVLQAINDAGVTGVPAALDQAAADKTLDTDFVWVLNPQQPTVWLTLINDLLAAVGYQGLWVDEVGQYRSHPYVRPSDRGSEWTFDLADPRTNIVGPQRTLETDTFERLNWWRFIRENTDTRPTEGNGQYTVDRSGAGTKYAKVVRLTAADQESLVAQGDRIVDSDTRVVRRLNITTGPMPNLGHFDVVRIEDPSLPTITRAMAHSWSTTLDGSDTSLVLEVL